MLDIKKVRENPELIDEILVKRNHPAVSKDLLSTDEKNRNLISELQKIQEERSNNQNIYRAYVLIEWDEGAANKRLLQKIKEDEKLYTLMRSTELFEEMDKKVEKYSAGCQVFSDPEAFDRFMTICQRAAGIWGNKFSYTLLTYKD